MSVEHLIDFSSPLGNKGSMLNPLVPLPKYQSSNVQSSANGVTTVGDNPFDNVIMQLCKNDDPFEVIENQALEPCEETNAFSVIQNTVKECVTEESKENLKEINNAAGSTYLHNSHAAETKYDSVNSFKALDVDRSFSLHKKSLSETCLTSKIENIETKFLELCVNTQFDKQILDESSKCIDSEIKDISLGGNSTRNMSRNSENSFNMMDIPKRKEDVKAFVASRIEKCIEKALNNSRTSLNSSFRHRRSLSAVSLHTSTIPLPQCSENHFSSGTTKQNSEIWNNTMKYKNRSFSSNELYSSFNTRMWESQQNILNVCNNEKLSTVDKWNTAFRKSTATSSMYSSCGALETGFRKSTISSYRSSTSSVPNHFSAKISANDSVFLNNDTVVVGGKESSCVFMEAKNLSFVLKRQAFSADDEPVEADLNFLTEDNFQMDLVDSDSSSDEDNKKEKSTSRNGAGKKNPCEVDEKDLGQVSKNNYSNNGPMPLSRHKVAGMGLRVQKAQPKKPRSPLFVPAPRVPLSSDPGNGKVVLRTKSLSDNKIGKQGPMKAVLPLGNMMRNGMKKEHSGLQKHNAGQQERDSIKSVPTNNGLRRSISTGDLGLHAKKKSVSATSKVESPAALSCGQPIACSTPAPNDVLPLVSPPVRLQLSHISGGTSHGPVDLGHRRSKSAETTTLKKTRKDPQLTTTPTRRGSQHIRSDSVFKSKHSSPDTVSPDQAPAYTSTPLKPISKNSPSFNRVKGLSPVRKLLQRESLSRVEKENLKPRVAERHRLLLRAPTRRMEL